MHNMKNARGKYAQRERESCAKKKENAAGAGGGAGLEVMLKKGFGLWPHFL